MTSPPNTQPPRQIIIAATCYADATRAIPMAAGLARWAKADLHGILVEQDVTLTATGMFTTCLITPAGAQVAAPTTKQMRRLLAADARDFEAELAKLAGASLRRWTFERLKGDLMVQMRAAAEQGDILLVGHHGFYRHHGAVILIHNPGQNQGQAQHRAFDIATQLGRNQNAPLFIWAAAPDPEQRHFASVELEAMLRRADLPGSVARVFGSATEILEQINRSSAVAVIIDTQSGPFRSDADMNHLLDVGRCPLVITGSADAPMSMEHPKPGQNT
ncbi:MAG: hypothetical protein ACI8R4_004231 [Paracoccaceae bacterium]|jgi:hypothetical protein